MITKNLSINFNKKHLILFKNLKIFNLDYKNFIFKKNDYNLSKKVDYIFKNNNYFFYKFSNKNFKNLSKLNHLIENVFDKNQNVIFLDYNYKFYLPIYNYIYGVKTIYSNKNFFFIQKQNLSLNNWIYFYLLFLKKYNIKTIALIDYYEFNKFLKILNKFEIPIISLIPDNIKSVYIDYAVYFNKKNLNILKFLFLNNILNLYFKSLKYKSVKKKIIFLKKI